MTDTKPQKISLYVKFHPRDAKKIIELCNRFGVDPRDFICIGAMRYAENVTRGVEPPPSSVNACYSTIFQEP